MTAALAQPRLSVGARAGIVLSDDVTELRRLARWLDSETRSWGLSDSCRFALDLCLQEAVDNIIHYGFAGHSHQTTPRITVELTRLSQAVQIQIEDNAPPFNPTLQPAPPARRSLDEAAGGGQGIALMRRFMDEIVYSFADGHNSLTLLRHH
jgi:serine/threonine-protein kinase RsbW